VVLAAVSPGAEVLADGHIHVYGPLNGRAMAGVQGDTSACIFCRRFNAELVAVAGRYQVSDNIGDDERGGEVRICLRDEALTIEALPGAG
jgi:septum site-determining protein MinC